MGDSFTLTLPGTSSVLEAHYFPPIELSPFKNYALGLVELLTFNSIPNIDEGKIKFYVGEEILYLPIPILTGSYEIEDIENYLQKVLSTHDISISLQPNNSRLVNFLPNIDGAGNRERLQNPCDEEG